MIPLILISVLIAAGVGLLIKLLLVVYSDYEITWKEYLVGALAIAVVVAPLTAFVGFRLAKSNALSFHEYWNGWETETVRQIIPCSKDGPCKYEYSCDPYTVTYTTTDSEGNTTTHTEIRYHDCPYADSESVFRINTTLGWYDIARTASDKPWDRGEAIPANVPRGIPPFWAAAKVRIDANDPGPVTKRMKYDNFILASDESILRSYSDRIATLQRAKALPPVATDVRDFYYSNKVSFVGYKPDSPGDWQRALMYFNAALGSELQGDLHLVVTGNPTALKSPDGYITALKAYWSNPEVFGDDSISKNSIVVAIGTEDGQTVSWARAVTGMPLGNEATTRAIQTKLEGLELDPAKVIGTTKSNLKGKTLYGEGVLEDAVFGLTNKATQFKRVSMTGEDKDDIGTGFKYLDAQIQPSGTQKFWMFFIIFLISTVVWGVMVIRE